MKNAKTKVKQVRQFCCPAPLGKKKKTKKKEHQETKTALRTRKDPTQCHRCSHFCADERLLHGSMPSLCSYTGGS
jgi:hypothetical protein